MEQNISKIKKRIILFADYMGLSKRKIYLATGISNGILDKKTGLTEDTIEKFISTYPEVNAEWLLTGKGEMLKQDNKKEDKLQASAEEFAPCPFCAEKDKLIKRLNDHLDRLEREIDRLNNQIDRLNNQIDSLTEISGKRNSA